jgi:hypothetical protein
LSVGVQGWGLAVSGEARRSLNGIRVDGSLHWRAVGFDGPLRRRVVRVQRPGAVRVRAHGFRAVEPAHLDDALEVDVHGVGEFEGLESI